MSKDYVREKLSIAVSCLAASAAPIRERVGNAGLSGLTTLTAEDFWDADEGARFERIREALGTFSPIGDEGSMQTSAAFMTEERAVEIAREITELYHLAVQE